MDQQIIITILVFAACAAIAVTAFVCRSRRKGMEQKMQDAAYKVLKEKYLEQAIRIQKQDRYPENKTMVFLSWKDSGKNGYVFDAEQTIKIGRDPERNDLCIRDRTVSEQHCMLFLYENRLVVQDLDSTNGTYVKKGMFQHRVSQTEFLSSGDSLIFPGYKIRVEVFPFDTSCL